MFAKVAWKRNDLCFLYSFNIIFIVFLLIQGQKNNQSTGSVQRIPLRWCYAGTTTVYPSCKRSLHIHIIQVKGHWLSILKFMYSYLQLYKQVQMHLYIFMSILQKIKQGVSKDVIEEFQRGATFRTLIPMHLQSLFASFMDNLYISIYKASSLVTE